MIWVSCVLMLLGAAVIVLGEVLWKKQRITIIHDYHYTKVKPEDVPAYTRAMGFGTIGAGISIFIMGLLWAFNIINIGVVVSLICFAVSLIIYIFAQIKYNKGIF